MTSRRAPLALVVALLAACGGGGGGGGGGGDHQVTVMTRNLFLGSGLELLFDPAAVANLPASVRKSFEEVQASNPPARMAKVADEIVAAKPDLVGLQEAARYATQVVPATTETLQYDFVQLILDALQQRGVTYHLVDGAVSTNFDQAVPDDTGRLVHFTDRDAILARDGVATSAPANGRFQTLLGASLGIYTIRIPRGWGAVTAGVNGATLRFLNTHLEAIDDPTQVRVAQAREIAALAVEGSAPTLLVGDFNSPPVETSGAYGAVHGAGLEDSWDHVHPGDPGPTCCFGDTLQNASDPLTTRIDLAWFRGAFTAQAAHVVGEDAAADRTATTPPLWPSDHAGLVATLRAP